MEHNDVLIYRIHTFRCRLYEPTHGDLKVNKNVKFKLEAYNATAVAVIVHHQWFYLKQGDDAFSKVIIPESYSSSSFIIIRNTKLMSSSHHVAQTDDHVIRTFRCS